MQNNKLEYPSFFPGLPNLGNTCFLNSSLQALFNLPLFSKIFLKQNQKSLIFSNLNELFTLMLSENDIKETLSNFLSIFQSKYKNFDLHIQQDAQEFLSILLQELHQTLNKGDFSLKPIFPKFNQTKDVNIQKKNWQNVLEKSEKSQISSIFSGILLNSLSCESCGYDSKEFESFWDLGISLKEISCILESKIKGMQLTDLLKQLTKGEKIQKFCPKCIKLTNFIKKSSIVKYPKTLIIQIRRFIYKQDYGEKVTIPIKFPIQTLNYDKIKYTLTGVIHHLGSSLYSGHYIAECKHPFTGEWLRYDDSDVYGLDQKDLEFEKKGSETAYLLFYSKIM